MTDGRPSPRLMQLYSLRAQVEALIAGEESEMASVCQHPEEKRRDMSTMGGERQFRCLACGDVVAGLV